MPKRSLHDIRIRGREILTGPRGWLLLLALAACFHVAITVSVFIVGRTRLLPAQFDQNGLGAFASDSFFYQGDVSALIDKLKTQGFMAWLQSVAPLHIKLYSLSYLFFSRWMSPNIVTYEPLNLFYYLAILGLVYKLGETVVDRRAGLIAMIIIGVWPSFLMHTTQLIRDPLLIVAVLFFILVVATWLTEASSFKWDLLIVAPAVLAVLTIWIVRLAMWDAVHAIVLMGIVLLIVRAVRERRFFAGHAVNAVILCVAIVAIPQSQTVKSQQRREADIGKPLIAERAAAMPIQKRIEERREGFAKLKTSSTGSAASTASNIDDDKNLLTAGDFIRYLPRATEIGFLAPFPNMWFVKGGNVGRTGRIISGFETFATYLLEILAIVGLWRERRNLAAWLMAFTTTSALIALGYIVLNIGSLYRFRYPFLMLIVVLACAGATFLWDRYYGRTNAVTELKPASSN